MRHRGLEAIVIEVERVKSIGRVFENYLVPPNIQR